MEVVPSDRCQGTDAQRSPNHRQREGEQAARPGHLPSPRSRAQRGCWGSAVQGSPADPGVAGDGTGAACARWRPHRQASARAPAASGGDVWWSELHVPTTGKT